MTSLLPPNRTALEAAVSAVIAASFPRDTAAIARLFDPDLCPAELLPFLAWELSVDLWDERWHEVTKRKVCREAYRLHALKTTLAGIREHVALTGATVRRAIRPCSAFHYPAMDDARRNEWLDRLPQVRLAEHRQRGEVRSRNFWRARPRPAWDRLTLDRDEDEWSFDCGHSLFDMSGDDPALTFRPSFFGQAWARRSRGDQLVRTRATWWDQGEEMEIPLLQPERGVFRFIVPAQGRPDWMGAAFFGAARARRSRALERLVTIRPDADAASFAIAAGAEPIAVLPREAPIARSAPGAIAFFGRHSVGRFLRRSAGDRLVSRRISIHVPERMGARRRARMFFGAARLPMHPFSAELRIEVPMRRPRSRRAAWHRSGYMRGADMRPLANALQAVKASKAFRDTVLIDTAVHRTVEFSAGLSFGDFTFGQIMEAN